MDMQQVWAARAHVCVGVPGMWHITGLDVSSGRIDHDHRHRHFSGNTVLYGRMMTCDDQTVRANCQR